MRVARVGPQGRFYYAAAAGLLLVFFFLTIGSILIGHLSLTFDEPQHFRYGQRILEGNPDRFIDSPMPISVPNVLASRAASAVAGPEQFRWLRDNFKPDGAIRYTHLFYEISPEELDSLDRSGMEN